MAGKRTEGYENELNEISSLGFFQYSFQKGVSDKCHTDAGIPVKDQPPINDINHLVRRVEQPKRTLADEEAEAMKRPKMAESTSNSNGVTTKMVEDA